jgi:hypothetical protein
MLSALLARLHLTPHRERLQSTSPARIAICPPALLGSGPAHRLGLFRWLTAGWRDSSLTVAAPSDAQQRPTEATPLWAVRLEFMRALHGVRTQQAGDLLERISNARSLRELWHLRTEVFNRVAHYRDQNEAHARLASLNRHFPTRAPSTGFGALDAAPHAPHSREFNA